MLKMKPTTSAGTPLKQGSIGQISKAIWVTREEQKGSHSREKSAPGKQQAINGKKYQWRLILGLKILAKTY